MNTFNMLTTLFFTFCRIGCFTFGGGYAMLPMLEKEIVENHGWATQEEIMDYFAIGQCTPGIIAANTATFIGYKQFGILGGIVATLGVTFPSIIIILLIASILQQFDQLVIVQQAFAGIRIIVGVLVLNTIVKMWRSAIVDWVGILIFIITFIISIFTSISPVYIIIATILLGITLKKERKS